jgi:hypothetical protein
VLVENDGLPETVATPNGDSRVMRYKTPILNFGSKNLLHRGLNIMRAGFLTVHESETYFS